MMEEVNSSMIYLIYFKNICKCHNVPLPSTTIKIKVPPHPSYPSKPAFNAESGGDPLCLRVHLKNYRLS
jgi:hypothetical protein